MTPGKHRCPGCRKVEVEDARLACGPCWFRLPQAVRNEVVATRGYRLLHERRRRALAAAVEVWHPVADLPGNTVR